MRSGLTFLRDHLLLPLPMGNPDAGAAGSMAGSVPKGQARIASVEELRALITVAAGPNKVAAYVALSASIMARAGVRFEHVRRSRLFSQCGGGAWFTCSQGKARERGAPAPAFAYFVPEVCDRNGPFPLVCLGLFCKSLRDVLLEAPSFLLPASPPHCASALSALCRWARSAVPYGRCHG